MCPPQELLRYLILLSGLCKSCRAACAESLVPEVALRREMPPDSMILSGAIVAAPGALWRRRRNDLKKPVSFERAGEWTWEKR